MTNFDYYSLIYIRNLFHNKVYVSVIIVLFYKLNSGEEDVNMAKAIINLPGVEQFVVNGKNASNPDKQWKT